MPELPEVESVRTSVEPFIVGRRVLAARLFRRDVLITPGDPPGGFSRQRGTRQPAPRRYPRTDLLAGMTIIRVDRRGKQLAIIAHHDDASAAEAALVVQLGMTGGLQFFDPSTRTSPTHVHAAWHFEHGRLLFRDPRRFGGLRAFRSSADLHEHWEGLGPDALSITPRELGAALKDSSRPLKAALLDQAVLAGVGNIYADEALHAARLHPARPAGFLTRSETVRLARAVREVLLASVEAGGSTLRDYADATGAPGSYQRSHEVYGRAGQPCRRCRQPLDSARLAQRATVWCPVCQPV